MKNIIGKLVTSQTLLIVGLIVLSIGGRWSFFTGLALVMVSGRFALRRDSRPMRFIAWIIWAVFCIGFIGLLVWVSSFGAEKPPLTALIGAWLAFSVDEYYWWEMNRGRA